MPTILFHLKVASEYVKKNNKYDTNNFYLGMIAPDAVNAYGFASKEKRWGAHIRDKDLNKWKENVIEFYKRNIRCVEEDFLRGYCIHILTDIVMDEKYANSFRNQILEKGIEEEKVYDYYEKAIYKYENSKLNEDWIISVVEKIKSANIFEFNNISKQLQIDNIKYNIDKYSKREYEEADFIKDDVVEDIIKEIQEILHNCAK